jgi:hypothetical protein
VQHFNGVVWSTPLGLPTKSLHTYELTSGLLKTSLSTEALIGKSATMFATKNKSKVNSKLLVVTEVGTQFTIHDTHLSLTAHWEA